MLIVFNDEEQTVINVNDNLLGFFKEEAPTGGKWHSKFIAIDGNFIRPAYYTMAERDKDYSKVLEVVRIINKSNGFPNEKLSSC